jgi:hypothetical protein
MRWKKFMIILVLLIFTTGMLMGAASAGHTIKCGKYKATISDKQYKKLKKANKNGDWLELKVKTNKKYTVKKPKYKTKKVKKWVYKKVLQTKTTYSADWSDYTIKDYNIDKYWDNGWTYYGQKDSESNGGHVYKSYAKFKKKVTVKKKVKTGYTKSKKKLTMYLYDDGEVTVFNGDTLMKRSYIKLN